MFLIVPVLIIYIVPPDLLREESRETIIGVSQYGIQFCTSSKFSHLARIVPGLRDNLHIVSVGVLQCVETSAASPSILRGPPARPQTRPEVRYLQSSNTHIHTPLQLWYDMCSLVLCCVGVGFKKQASKCFRLQGMGGITVGMTKWWKCLC